MTMYDFETIIDFIGEERQAIIGWDEVDGECVVRTVSISILIRHNYLPSGKFAPHFEHQSLDIKNILSDDQIWSFIEEIRESARKKQAGDFSLADLLFYEDRLYGKAA